MPPAPGPRGSPAAGGVSGALAPRVSVQGMENCSLPGPEPAHLPQVTEHRRSQGGLRTNPPLCLWVLGDSRGLNEGEEAGAGVGAGVRCHPSALPQGGGCPPYVLQNWPGWSDTCSPLLLVRSPHRHQPGLGDRGGGLEGWAGMWGIRGDEKGEEGGRGEAGVVTEQVTSLL